MRLLIAGMHRSGTSLIAQWVARLGVPMGQGPLFEVDSANPRGLYERQDVVAFNEQWLHRLGGAWWAPPFLTDQTWRDLDPHSLKAARADLDLFGADAGSWFVKDPRISLLVPLWDRLCLSRLPLVVGVRSPREVAMSLHVRNGTTYRRGLALWVAYNRAVLKHASERDVLVLEVASTLAEPGPAAEALAAFLAQCGFTSAPADLDVGVEPELIRQKGERLPGSAERLACDLDPAFAALSDLHATATQRLTSPMEVPDWAEEALAELSTEWGYRTRIESLERQPSQQTSLPRRLLRKSFHRGSDGL